MPRSSRKSPVREEDSRHPALAMATAAVSGAVGAVLAWLLEAIPWP
ncbi:hypothetical protein [Streptomyces longisporoflavus]|nr:hypothetical protein [Streptomyces longisporoflavus]